MLSKLSFKLAHAVIIKLFNQVISFESLNNFQRIAKKKAIANNHSWLIMQIKNQLNVGCLLDAHPLTATVVVVVVVVFFIFCQMLLWKISRRKMLNKMKSREKSADNIDPHHLGNHF